MMTSTLTDQAVAGRRIQFTYHHDLPDGPAYPGIITSTKTAVSGAPLAYVRLDGKRSNLTVPVDYEGLRYLDEIVPVPALPVGRFRPTAKDFEGEWEGVLVCQLADEDIIALTGNPALAEAALTAYCTDMGMDLEFVDLYAMEARWAVFEWRSEDAESPWTVCLDAAESDDMAVRLYYLPA